MRIRLARKIKKNSKRYSWGKVRNALIRLGWQQMTWKATFKTSTE